MIKINKLRIGNWIDEQGLYLQVGMINSELFKSSEPIPLTLDWLIKFGFEGSSIIVNEYSLDWFTVELSGAVKFRCNEGCLDRKVFKYVHELQNFYYAATGNELEIKNKYYHK